MQENSSLQIPENSTTIKKIGLASSVRIFHNNRLYTQTI